MQREERGADATVTRAGYVALAGRPNVGKSTLLNALVGEKLSIVTPRPQTTRETVTGILSRRGYQAVFVDTPGLMEASYLLHESMLHAARAALEQADVVLLLLDGTQKDGVPGQDVVDLLGRRVPNVVVAVNKVDVAPEEAVAELGAWSRARLGVEAVGVSALTGEGLDGLLAELVPRLPEGPYLFPVDELATQPVRFFVEELVRETVFELYGQEVPYSTAVRIEEYREAADPVFIRAVVYVERESQRGIVIGHGGARIRELGTRARGKIEAFIDARVYLDLWVKTMPAWRRKAGSLKRLGYPVPGPEGGRR
jgi:GTP-binding protein Era